MEELIKKIQLEAEKKIAEIKDSKELQELKVKILGKKSELSEALKNLKDLSAEERPKMGALVNTARQKLEEKIKEMEEKFANKNLEEKLEKEAIDITLPSKKIRRGSEHPLNRVIEEIEDLFTSMGYDVVEGPELETDEYCFERLNLPQGHPPRSTCRRSCRGGIRAPAAARRSRRFCSGRNVRKGSCR